MNDNLIGPDAELEGELRCKGTLHVQGKFTGEVTANHTVQVDEGGIVKGTLNGTTIKVIGSVEGEIGARKSLEAGKGCHIRGHLVTQPEMIIVHQDADLGKEVNPEWENPPLPDGS